MKDFYDFAAVNLETAGPEIGALLDAAIPRELASGDQVVHRSRPKLNAAGDELIIMGWLAGHESEAPSPGLPADLAEPDWTPQVTAPAVKSPPDDAPPPWPIGPWEMVMLAGPRSFCRTDYTGPWLVVHLKLMEWRGGVRVRCLVTDPLIADDVRAVLSGESGAIERAESKRGIRIPEWGSAKYVKWSELYPKYERLLYEADGKFIDAAKKAKADPRTFEHIVTFGREKIPRKAPRA